jgi:hypothetical protein
VPVAFAVVPAPVLVLLPPMPEPVEPAVCAPAQAKAASMVGARSHVRFILDPSAFLKSASLPCDGKVLLFDSIPRV